MQEAEVVSLLDMIERKIADAEARRDRAVRQLVRHRKANGEKCSYDEIMRAIKEAEQKVLKERLFGE